MVKRKFSKWLPIAVLLPLIGLIQTLTMPAYPASTDSAAIRYVATHWVQTGEFGFPYSRMSELPAVYTKIRGQFFIPNDERQRLYSHWGEVNTLLVAVVEVLRGADGLGLDEGYVLYTNLLNIGLTLVFAFYLILTAGLFQSTLASTTIYMFAVIYSAFTWAYLRTPSYEITQLTLFYAFSFHFLKFLNTVSRRHLYASQVALLVLIHVKFFFVLLYLPAAALVPHLRRNARMSTWLAIGMGLAVAILSNWAVVAFKTGSLAFATDAPLAENWASQWSLEYFETEFWNYTVGPKASLIIYFPFLILSIFLWPSFYRRHQIPAQFALGVFAISFVPLLFYATYGEWCIGPRYLLFVLPAMCWPIATLKKLRPIFSATLVGTLMFGCCLQWQIVSMPLYSRQKLVGLLSASMPDPKPAVDEIHAATDYYVFWRISQFINSGTDYAPIEALLQSRPESERATPRARIRQDFRSLFDCNFYFVFLCRSG